MLLFSCRDSAEELLGPRPGKEGREGWRKKKGERREGREGRREGTEEKGKKEKNLAHLVHEARLSGILWLRTKSQVPRSNLGWGPASGIVLVGGGVGFRVT